MYKVTVKGEASAYTEDGVDYKGSESNNNLVTLRKTVSHLGLEIKR